MTQRGHGSKRPLLKEAIAQRGHGSKRPWLKEAMAQRGHGSKRPWRTGPLTLTRCTETRFFGLLESSRHFLSAQLSETTDTKCTDPRFFEADESLRLKAQSPSFPSRKPSVRPISTLFPGFYFGSRTNFSPLYYILIFFSLIFPSKIYIYKNHCGM